MPLILVNLCNILFFFLAVYLFVVAANIYINVPDKKGSYLARQHERVSKFADRLLVDVVVFFLFSCSLLFIWSRNCTWSPSIMTN